MNEKDKNELLNSNLNSLPADESAAKTNVTDKNNPEVLTETPTEKGEEKEKRNVKPRNVNGRRNLGYSE